MFHCAKLNLKKYSLLKDIHLWKIFTPEKYSPLKNIHPWKYSPPEKCSPWKYSPLKNINVNIELLSQWTVWVSQVGSAALEKVLSILSLYSIWCWRKCFGTAAALNVQIRMEDGMDESKYKASFDGQLGAGTAGPGAMFAWPPAVVRSAPKCCDIGLLQLAPEIPYLR